MLRFCHVGGAPYGPLLSDAALRMLDGTRELDYLTHMVLRMYENVDVPLSDPRRFRVDLTFSPGSALSPVEVRCN